MSSDLAIELRNVSKGYSIYQRPSDRLKQALWRGKRKFYSEFWALHGIDLEIKKGETVGIVGRNGSGKSTLLQIIAGTLTPSGGTTMVNGRVAALLELGTGFNPEFTGRENVFMNAAILGLRQKEINQQLQSIIDFAEIGEFLDRPVKTYSSGMYARLAFAVAISVDPDILIVDEALSVGDEAFQRKCFARINAMRKQGKTILFVTHSVGTILELCDRAVLIDHGERLCTGSPRQVVALYQKIMYAAPERLQEMREFARRQDVEGDAAPLPDAEEPAEEQLPDNVAQLGATTAKSPVVPETAVAHFDPGLVSKSVVAYAERGARLQNLVIRDAGEQQVNVLVRGAPYTFEFEAEFFADADNVHFSMLIKALNGVELAAQWSVPPSETGPNVSAGERLLVRFPMRLPFTPGSYFLNAGITGTEPRGERVVYHRLIDAVMVRIQPVPLDRADRYVSILTGEEPTISRQGAGQSERKESVRGRA